MSESETIEKINEQRMEGQIKAYERAKHLREIKEKQRKKLMKPAFEG